MTAPALDFERGVMKFSALSIPHFRLFMERSVGPMQKLAHFRHRMR